MLISKSLIFAHYPKTGGSSVQAYLVKAVKGRYYPMDDPSMNRAQKEWITHQGLQVAFQYATRLGLDPWKIPVLTCIRNPYDLMLSGYLFLKQKHGDKIDDLEDTYLGYLESLTARTPAEVLQGRAQATYGPYTGFMVVGRERPANLNIARTERLQEDVTEFLAEQVGARVKFRFPHKNRTVHKHFSRYYGEREEQLVYDMWQNTFESGLYQRFEGLD